MGAVKELAVVGAEAGVEFVELLDSGISFVITGEPGVGFTWYLPPDGGEYAQDDWIFHALKTGRAPTLDAAAKALGAAVCEFHATTAYAMSRTTKPQLRSVP